MINPEGHNGHNIRHDKSNTRRLLRLKHVLERIPVSRSTWYAGIAAGRFPAPVKLGPRTSAWREQDIDALVNFGVTEDNENSERAI